MEVLARVRTTQSHLRSFQCPIRYTRNTRLARWADDDDNDVDHENCSIHSAYNKHTAHTFVCAASKPSTAASLEPNISHPVRLPYTHTRRSRLPFRMAFFVCVLHIQNTQKERCTQPATRTRHAYIYLCLHISYVRFVRCVAPKYPRGEQHSPSCLSLPLPLNEVKDSRTRLSSV